MPLNVEQILSDCAKVVDLSEKIQLIENLEKIKATKLLSNFDIEWSEDVNKVKHYPLDDYSLYSTSDDINSRIERLSKVLWLTVGTNIQNASAHLLPKDTVEPMNFGDRPAKAKKIGKIYTCRPHRFNTVGVTVGVVQPYLYSYKLADGSTEMQAEINFGIEIY